MGKVHDTHYLYTKDDFTEDEINNDGALVRAVLDGGLAVCKKCGDYESGLDTPCKKAAGYVDIYAHNMPPVEHEFFIVNDADRPDERHITILSGAADLNYIHPDLRDWGTMSLRDCSTNVKEFGFVTTESGGFVTFKRTAACRAVYDDGRKPRLWQGDDHFTMNLNIL